jgi:hypothetical protein
VHFIVGALIEQRVECVDPGVDQIQFILIVRPEQVFACSRVIPRLVCFDCGVLLV